MLKLKKEIDTLVIVLCRRNLYRYRNQTYFGHRIRPKHSIQYFGIIGAVQSINKIKIC